MLPFSFDHALEKCLRNNSGTLRILFIAVKITEEELQEAMQSFESVETAQEPIAVPRKRKTKDTEDDDEE